MSMGPNTFEFSSKMSAIWWMLINNSEGMLERAMIPRCPCKRAGPSSMLAHSLSTSSGCDFLSMEYDCIAFVCLLYVQNQRGIFLKWEFSFVSHIPLLSIPLLTLKCPNSNEFPLPAFNFPYLTQIEKWEVGSGKSELHITIHKNRY